VEDGERAIEASRTSREQGWSSAGVRRLGRGLVEAAARFVAFEARNPELEGRRNLGAAISEFAHADRQDCPEE